MMACTSFAEAPPSNSSVASVWRRSASRELRGDSTPEWLREIQNGRHAEVAVEEYRAALDRMGDAAFAVIDACDSEPAARD